MEIKEVISFLDDLMIKNNFTFSARTECLYQNIEKIENMHNVFDLRTSEDFTCLYAVSTLLSDSSKAVDEYLLYENKDSNLINNIQKPTRKDLLLVATAMEENPKFFSRAVYWIGIVEDRLDAIINELKLYDFSSEQEMSDALHKRIGYHLVVDGTDLGLLASFKLEYPYCTLNFSDGNKIFLDIKKSQRDDSSSNNVLIDFTYFYDKQIDELKYAASGKHEGWGENITKIPVGNIGELKILGDSDTQQIVVDFFISEAYQNLRFELTVEFDVKGESLIAVLRKETPEVQTVISSEPIDYDFKSALKLKYISCKPL